MSFSQICVGIVLWFLILFITEVIDRYSTDDGYTEYFLSTIGFALFLTETLIHYGVI